MLPENISQFPITNHLSHICDSLKNSDSHVLILTAETAAGKSTILPLALMEEFPGKIIMTEPRRLAVLGVSNRIAELKNEECGSGSVGYKIHLESKTGKNNRLEVVTEAILVRQLQNDSVLENYNVVVIDEFHERSINTDLALAFLKEALVLRDDLYVIVMSATIDTGKLQNYFGQSTPVLKIPGRQFPVDFIYEDKWSVEKAVVQALKMKDKGNILVFLPGISDIRKAQEKCLEVIPDDVDLLVLHSSISLNEQKKVLTQKDGSNRRVILSSAIAETSLTVPGVNCVIDSGVSRINRMNISTGMENLTTETESEFSAEQRAGRAGRLEPGICIRLWSNFDPRQKTVDPEILRADLCSLVLDCAERGVFTSDGIDWLDKPNAASWVETQKLLQNLSFIKDDFHITERGKITGELGMHPRLAGIAMEGFDGKALSKQAAAYLLKYGSYAKSSEDIKNRFIEDVEKRLNVAGYKSAKKKEPLILQGYPDRLAKRITGKGVYPAEYQFPSGRKALIYEGVIPDWIAAPQVMAGQSEGVIFEFEEITEVDVMSFLEGRCETRTNCFFVDGKVQKTEDVCYGQLVISSKRLNAGNEDISYAWVNEVLKKGIECLPLDDKTRNFLLRVEFFEQQNNADRETVLSEKLQANVSQWLLPFIGTVNKITAQTVYDALYWYLEGSKIDEQVPEVLILDNGRRCKVKYEKQAEIKPVIEIIIQRIFGCFETPVICGKKVLLRLLSPASRPLQVTEDLAGFWTGAWPEICKEMKGRYPKHNWDYKIAEKD